MANALKSWVMAALTFVFVALYGAALSGLLKPLADEKMVMRLEPIIFVIIGYYFGRLPAQQNEQSLKDEITRQTQKADAAQHAKEQVQQSREAFEEKMKNVRAALATTPSGTTTRGAADHLNKVDGAVKDEMLRHSVSTALKILDS
jgi:predicted Co/Zn/Cd cation transporter (cation efflux family)